jgi:hypothetical protein
MLLVSPSILSGSSSGSGPGPGLGFIPSPDPTQLPGFPVLQDLTNGVEGWALIAAVVGVVIGAILWAFGRRTTTMKSLVIGARRRRAGRGSSSGCSGRYLSPQVAPGFGGHKQPGRSGGRAGQSRIAASEQLSPWSGTQLPASSRR